MLEVSCSIIEVFRVVYESRYVQRDTGLIEEKKPLLIQLKAAVIHARPYSYGVPSRLLLC